MVKPKGLGDGGIWSTKVSIEMMKQIGGNPGSLWTGRRSMKGCTSL